MTQFDSAAESGFDAYFASPFGVRDIPGEEFFSNLIDTSLSDLFLSRRELFQVTKDYVSLGLRNYSTLSMGEPFGGTVVDVEWDTSLASTYNSIKSAYETVWNWLKTQDVFIGCAIGFMTPNTQLPRPGGTTLPAMFTELDTVSAADLADWQTLLSNAETTATKTFVSEPWVYHDARQVGVTAGLTDYTNYVAANIGANTGSTGPAEANKWQGLIASSGLPTDWSALFLQAIGNVATNTRSPDYCHFDYDQWPAPTIITAVPGGSSGEIDITYDSGNNSEIWQNVTDNTKSRAKFKARLALSPGNLVNASPIDLADAAGVYTFTGLVPGQTYHISIAQYAAASTLQVIFQSISANESEGAVSNVLSTTAQV